MTEFQRALFIQLRRIGDVLLCTPAVRAFKANYPDCAIDFLTEHPDVLWGNQKINNLISVNRTRQYSPAYQFALIRRIRNARYDLVVDFLANPRSAWYAGLSGAPTRLSYGYGHRRWAYNLIPPKPENPSYAALDKLILLRPIGITGDDPRLDYFVSDLERKKVREYLRENLGGTLITLSPVSRRAYKRWPLDRFARLGDALAHEFGVRVAVLAGPGEDGIAERISAMMSHKPLIPRIHSLDQLGAFFEMAALHIGNDNGPKHIAVAAGAPTFTIFGRQNPASWTYPDSTRHFWISPDDYCVDCREKGHGDNSNCIEMIPYDAVWDKIKNVAGVCLGAMTQS